MNETRAVRTRDLDAVASPWSSIAGPKVRHVTSSLIGATFWLLFAYVNIHASVTSHRVIGIGVGVLGLWASLLFVIRRPPVQVSRSIPIWIVAFAATFGASLLRPGGPDSGWADALGLTLQGIAVILGAFGFMALGRSLGLVPAHRGLVTSGAYRVVRHPLYASYLVAELGYLVQSPRLWNLAVLLLVWACQILRIVSEERLLSHDQEYRSYKNRTRWRVIPGVW